jgi:type II secretory pathway component GspD/PulD (secretin)
MKAIDMKELIKNLSGWSRGEMPKNSLGFFRHMCPLFKQSEKTEVPIMNNTKRIAVMLFAGMILQQAALSQTNTIDTNAVYQTMVSNVVKLSTAAEGGTSTNPSTASAPATEETVVTSNATVTATDSVPPTVAAPSNTSTITVESNTSTITVQSNTSTITVQSNPAPVVAVSNPPVVAVSNEVAPTVTNVMPMAGSNQMVATVASNAPMAGIQSNQPAEMAAAGGEQAATATSTNAPAPVTAPIQFTDVPLDVAIQALAREADINYLLDPSIGWGTPDQNGQVKQPPTLSVRWDNVTPEQALLALLDNYSLQLIENPKTKIARITTRSPDQLPALITRVVQLRYAGTSNMMYAIQNALTDKRSRIVPDERTSQLVIVATDPEQSTMDTLINELDKPTRQVLIETRLVELSSTPSTTKGVDWSGTVAAQNVSFGNGIMSSGSSQTTIPGTSTTTGGFGGGGGTTTSTGSSTTTTLISTVENSLGAGGLNLNTASGLTPDIGFLSADGVKAVLSFLNQSSEAQVVSTPRVVTLDNEMATISVTREFPVINVQASTPNTSGGSTITYSNIGTILQVTPRITANDYIWLKVVPDISTFFGVDSKTISGFLYQADIFDQRHIETQVLIPNAHTLVMGGLVQDNPNAGYTKVPILGDIPGLGFFFRSETKSMDKDNLLIFITPTIVKDSDFKPMQSDFLNSQPRTMVEPMNMHTWWDSAQPRGNWSDPIAPQQSAGTVIETNQNTTSQ